MPGSNRNSASRAVQEQVDVLLVTVTDVEARAVLSTFQERADNKLKRHFINGKTYLDLGVIGGARTFMVQSEMGSGGTGGAILTIRESIYALSPSAVVMVGIAFGVDAKKQRIGDILVSKQILAYDFQRVGSNTEGQEEIILRGDRPQASIRLLDQFRSGVLDWEKPTVRFGLILSGEKLVDFKDFRDQLRKFALEVIGGEMEGAGLYAVAERYKVDWILVKGICDWADGKKSRNKNQRQVLAAKNAARFTLHVMRLGGLSGYSQQKADSGVIPNVQQPSFNPIKVDPVKLRKAMLNAYSKPSLELLCADLGVIYDNLQDGPLENKILYLIEYFQYHDLYEKLVHEVLIARPHLINQLK